MNYCNKCGNELKKEDDFCPKCGHKTADVTVDAEVELSGKVQVEHSVKVLSVSDGTKRRLKRVATKASKIIGYTIASILSFLFAMFILIALSGGFS